MKDSDMMPDTEKQLETLLRGLLGEDQGGRGRAQVRADVSPELIELCDLARRLHEVGQELPTPRQAFLAQVSRRGTERHGKVAGWMVPRTHRRYGAWVVIAAAMLLGVFGVGLGANWAGASPSSSWYGVRLAIENLQVAVTPDAHARALLLVRNAQVRIAEIQAMAATGDSGSMRRAADALDADVGWLHALLTILPVQERHQLVRGLGQV